MHYLWWDIKCLYVSTYYNMLNVGKKYSNLYNVPKIQKVTDT